MRSRRWPTQFFETVWDFAVKMYMPRTLAFDENRAKSIWSVSRINQLTFSRSFTYAITTDTERRSCVRTGPGTIRRYRSADIGTRRPVWRVTDADRISVPRDYCCRYIHFNSGIRLPYINQISVDFVSFYLIVIVSTNNLCPE